jgi:hypothetical protein
MKVMAGMMLLACVPLAAANGGGADYPTEKVAEFVFDHLDVKSVPAELRPKLEKGKKLLGEYGFTAAQLDEKNAVLDAPQGASPITIRVLDEGKSGIYVCLSGPAQTRDGGNFQRVLQLRRKAADKLLTGRETSREFRGCPAIGGEDTTTAVN